MGILMVPRIYLLLSIFTRIEIPIPILSDGDMRFIHEVYAKNPV